MSVIDIFYNLSLITKTKKGKPGEHRFWESKKSPQNPSGEVIRLPDPPKVEGMPPPKEDDLWVEPEPVSEGHKEPEEDEPELRGEWWLDDSGQATFADGDVGDYNHEMVAFGSALGVDLEDPEIPEMIPGEALSDEAVAWLRENGADEKAIDYLRGGADARDYAMDHMGWIRVKDNMFQASSFDDAALGNIQGFLADNFDNPDEMNSEIMIEDMSARKTYDVPIKYVMMEQATAEGLKNFSNRRRGIFEGGDAEKWEDTVFRGQTHAGGAGAAHGVGTYYGLDRKSAETFAKPGTIKEHRITLNKPAIVRSDADLKKLKMQAESATGKDFGKKGNLYEMLRDDQAKDFTEWMKSKGYDGMVVDYPEAAGGRQVVVFPEIIRR